MSQTTQGQAKAQKKWAKTAMATQRKGEQATDKVAPALSPNVPVGATSHNTAALRKNKIIYNVKGNSPASSAGLGQSSY